MIKEPHKIARLGTLTLMMLLLGLQGVDAQSVTADGRGTAGEDRYIACLDMADRAPDRAIDLALAWKADGGGVPARHCEALALARDGDYGEAAIRLESLIEDMRVGRDMPIIGGERLTADAAFLAQVYAQAANAWLLADETFRALDAIDAAIGLVEPQTPEELAYRVDRARIAAADGDYTLAFNDLARVRVFDPARRDILVLLASAARAIGRFEEAVTALDGYDAAFPDDPVAVLERAHLMDSLGKPEEARRLYDRVIALTKDPRLAELARANIERLGVTAGGEK